MSVDTRALEQYGAKLQALAADVPKIISELVVGEGVHAVKKAKRLATSEGVVNAGYYRNNFHAGDSGSGYIGAAEHDGAGPRIVGGLQQIDMYNNLDYAGHLEYGFRSHFVPGFWQGRTFVYVKGFPGGMYVGPPGGYVRGNYIHTRAIKETQRTQKARLSRKLSAILKERLGAT